jgi:hypothetical protein
MSKPDSTKLPAGLCAAGERPLPFTGDTIRRLLAVLEGSAGVMARRGDNAGDLRAFKLACGLNFARLRAVAERLGAEARALVAAADTDAWRPVALELQRAGEKVLGEAIPPDVVLAMAFDQADAYAHVHGAYGPEKAGELVRVAREIVKSRPDACLDRANAMKAAAAVVERSETVMVHCIRWDRLPRALHGGYLRDLAWMFVDVPAEVRELTDAATAQATAANGG